MIDNPLIVFAPIVAQDFSLAPLAERDERERLTSAA